MSDVHCRGMSVEAKAAAILRETVAADLAPTEAPSIHNAFDDYVNAMNNDDMNHMHSALSSTESNDVTGTGINMDFLDDLLRGSGSDNANDSDKYTADSELEASNDKTVQNLISEATKGDLQDSSSDDEEEDNESIFGNEYKTSSELMKSTSMTSAVKPPPPSTSSPPLLSPIDSSYKVNKFVTFNQSSKDKMSEEDWNRMIRNYYKKPVTALDHARDKFYKNMEVESFDSCTEEHQLYILHRTRLENEIIIKARLELLYEKKEGARRAAEWKRRKVMSGFKFQKGVLKLNDLSR